MIQDGMNGVNIMGWGWTIYGVLVLDTGHHGAVTSNRIEDLCYERMIENMLSIEWFQRGETGRILKTIKKWKWVLELFEGWVWKASYYS